MPADGVVVCSQSGDGRLMVVDAGNVERVLERNQSLVVEEEAVVGSRVAYPLGRASGEGWQLCVMVSS